MGALALIDALTIGQTIELVSARGERVMATGAAPGGGATFFANLNSLGVFPVLQFGAVGDGVTLDTAAIVATDAAAAAFGSVTTKGAVVYFHNPPNAFATGSPLTPSPGNRWVGQATTFGQCILRAVAAMTAVIIETTTNYAAGPGLVTNELYGLTIDANFQATSGVLRNSDFFSKYECVFIQNAIRDCEHSPSLRIPVNFSAVTQVGGGPAIVGAITAGSDPLYSGLSGTTNVVLKINAAQTFLISLDGGATFGTASQTIPTGGGLVNLAGSAGSVLAQALGIQWPFPAGPFTVNTTYAVTATFPPTANTSVNVETIHRNCRWSTCGSIACSNGLFNTYNGLLPTSPTILPGTASLVSGSQVITFSAPTGLVAFGPRNGDLIFLAGFPNAVPILCMLNDSQAAISQGTAAQLAILLGGANLTNVQWAVGVGALVWSDNMFVGDNGRNTYEGINWFGTAPQFMRLTGAAQGIARLDGCRFENFYAFLAVQLGGGGQAGTSFLSEFCEWKQSTFANSVPCYVGDQASGTFVEPQQSFVAVGTGTGSIQRGGSTTPIGSPQTFIPLGVEQVSNEFVQVNAAGFQFTAPAYTAGGGLSITEFTLTGTITSTASPLIAPTAPAFFNPNNTVHKRLVNRDLTHALIVVCDLMSGSGVLFEGFKMVIGPGDCIDLMQLPSNKWIARSGQGSNVAGNTGSYSDRNAGLLSTTTNVATSLYEATSAGFLPGTLYVGKLSAQRAANDVAHWTNIVAMTDNNGAIIASNTPIGGTLAAPLHAATAGASTWSFSLTVSGNQIHLNFIGDGNAGTVFVRAQLEPLVAPQSL